MFDEESPSETSAKLPAQNVQASVKNGHGEAEALPKTTSGAQSSCSPSPSEPSPSTPSSGQTSPKSSGSRSSTELAKITGKVHSKRPYKCAICRSSACASLKTKRRDMCPYFDPGNPNHHRKGWTNKDPERLRKKPVTAAASVAATPSPAAVVAPTNEAPATVPNLPPTMPLPAFTT